MAELKSYLLKGPSQSDISMPIGRLEDITEGTWEIGLSSISFAYTSSFSRSTLLQISCNFVMGKAVTPSGELEAVQTPMNMVLVKGTTGGRGIVGFRQRDFFEVNNAQQQLIFHLRDAETGNTVSGANIFLQVLLRRVR